MTDNETEFPFAYAGVTLELDDGGVWFTVDDSEPRWIGPRTLAALRASGILTDGA